MAASFDALEFQIKSFSAEEKALLARRIRASEIEMIFTNIKEAIAQEAKNKIQSKIALTFNHGYGHGNLFNSIYYKIEGDNITISSTKSYFAILNAGFASFDMKKSLLGRTVKMRLPGGKIIFRKVGNPNNKNPRKKSRPFTGGHNWIHPGIKGANIYQIVNNEMSVWIESYVATKMHSLIEMAKGRSSDVYATAISGKQYYNVREKSGRFTASTNNLEPSPLSKLLAEDVKRYKGLGPSGSYSPLGGF